MDSFKSAHPNLVLASKDIMFSDLDWNKPVDATILQVGMDIDFKVERLTDRAQSIKNSMDRSLESLTDGRGVNSLGVLQAEGVQFDVACGELNEAINGMIRLCWLHNKAV